jgi:periplasmic protein CpxP/Spy
MMRKILLLCGLIIGVSAAGFSQAKNVNTTDPAVKAKQLQKQLKLTDEQTKKITAVYEESAKKYAKIKADQHGDTNKMLVDIKPLRASTITKVKAVLTPKQSTEYDELLKSKKGEDGNGWGDGWSSTSN